MKAEKRKETSKAKAAKVKVKKSQRTTKVKAKSERRPSKTEKSSDARSSDEEKALPRYWPFEKMLMPFQIFRQKITKETCHKRLRRFLKNMFVCFRSKRKRSQEKRSELLQPGPQERVHSELFEEQTLSFQLIDAFFLWRNPLFFFAVLYVTRAFREVRQLHPSERNFTRPWLPKCPVSSTGIHVSKETTLHKLTGILWTRELNRLHTILLPTLTSPLHELYDASCIATPRKHVTLTSTQFWFHPLQKLLPNAWQIKQMPGDLTGLSCSSFPSFGKQKLASASTVVSEDSKLVPRKPKEAKEPERWEPKFSTQTPKGLGQ